MKTHIVSSLLIAALSFSTPAFAEPTKEDWKHLAMIEGVLLTSSAIVAADPEAWGKTYIVLSPILAGMSVNSDYPWTSYIAGVVFLGGYGYWLDSVKDEEQSEIIKKKSVLTTH